MSVPHNGFAALGVPDDLCAVLSRAGLVDPSPVQSAVIADALAGRDVSGRAPTGSGKTLAFGIPLVARLTPATRRRPTALVLAPTRELASQIATALRPLVRRRGHDLIAVYGGVGYGPQRHALEGGAELVVACPGRLEDLLASGVVELDDVATVVIDEADRMADMGFLPAVRRILERTRRQRQVLLFSATFDRAVTALAAAVQRDPVVHQVGAPGPDLASARHLFWTLAPTDRAATTADAIAAMGSTIVFCRTRHGADRLVKQLQRLGTSAAAIHGGRSQAQRDPRRCVRPPRDPFAHRHRRRRAWRARRRCGRRRALRSAPRRHRVHPPLGAYGTCGGQRRGPLPRRPGDGRRHATPPTTCRHRRHHHAGPPDRPRFDVSSRPEVRLAAWSR